MRSRKGSVVDRHRSHADLDQDPTFYFDADPDPDLDPVPSFQRVEKSEKSKKKYIFLL
jgi:hypothetical protein